MAADCLSYTQTHLSRLSKASQVCLCLCSDAGEDLDDLASAHHVTFTKNTALHF